MNPVEQIYITMRRNIALGKLTAFEEEAWRLADFVRSGVLNKHETIGALKDAARANFLPDVFGGELVAGLLREAFAEHVEAEAAA